MPRPSDEGKGCREVNQPVFRLRWRLYLAGLSLPAIKIREQAILKQVDVLLKAERFIDAQGRLLKTLLNGEPYGQALSGADAFFLALSVRRGQLS